MLPKEMMERFDKLIIKGRSNKLNEGMALVDGEDLAISRIRKSLEFSGVTGDELRLDKYQATVFYGIVTNRTEISKDHTTQKDKLDEFGASFAVIARDDGQVLIQKMKKNESLHGFENKSIDEIAESILLNPLAHDFLAPRTSRDSELQSIGASTLVMGQHDTRQWLNSRAYLPESAVNNGMHLQKDSCDSNARILGSALAVGDTDSLQFNSKFSVNKNRFSEKGMYMVLGLSLERDEEVSDFSRDYENFTRDSMDVFVEMAFSAQNEKLKQVNISNSQIDKDLYPLPIRNFIVSASDKQSMKYRKEFIDTSYRLLLGAEPGQQIDSIEFEIYMKSGIQKKISELIDTKSYAKNDIIDSIDAGKYPAKEIGLNFGFKSLSKQQFLKGMKMYGTYGADSDYGVYALKLIAPQNLSKAFALSKIPTEWVKWGSSDLFSKETIPLIQNELERVLGNMMPYMVNAGKEIDSMQALGDKAGIKNISKQWAWLSQGELPLRRKLLNFDAKYQVSQTMNDYKTMVENQFKTILMRTFSDVDNADFSECFELDTDSLSLEINEELAKSNVYNFLDEKLGSFEQDEPEFDDDSEFGYDDESEDLKIVNSLEGLYLPTSHDFQQLLKRGTSFKDVAEKNHKMHKGFSNYLTFCNRGSEKNLSWEPLIKEKLDLGNGLFAESINSRLDLLSEGHEMSHCVFSYLSKCLAGETAILSVKDYSGETPARVATVEIELDNRSESINLELTQCYGYSNKVTDISSKVEELMEDWVKKVNAGDIKTNAFAVVNADGMGDIVSLVESDPMNEGDVLCDVPFSTDAAYLAYYEFNKNTPPGIDVDFMMSENDSLREIYVNSSSLKKEIDVINSLAIKFNKKPEDIVVYKIENKIKSVMDISSHYDGFLSKVNGLDEIYKKYKDDYEPKQIAVKCANYLFEHGGLFVDDLDTLSDELSSLNPKFDSIVHDLVSQQNTNAKEINTPNDQVEQGLRMKR